jgi:hypothetical protein
MQDRDSAIQRQKLLIQIELHFVRQAKQNESFGWMGSINYLFQKSDMYQPLSLLSRLQNSLSQTGLLALNEISERSKIEEMALSCMGY